MVEVYYYVPSKDAENLIDCGIKLSQWYDREIILNSEPKKCLTAYLNPRDNMEKYRDTSLTCLKLLVEEKYCYVCDGALYSMSMNNPCLTQLFYESIVPVDKYIFGTYMLPECLVTTTIIGGFIREMNKKQDSPILFENSAELYLRNIIETNRDKNPQFDNMLLFYFFSSLAEISEIDKIVDKENKWVIFRNRRTNKIITLRVPDINEVDVL